MDAKATDSFRDRSSQLITLAVCCGYVSNLIGRRTIYIPEMILGVHGLMGFTVITDSFHLTTTNMIPSSAFSIC